jgi:hypothetical protein
LGESRLAGPPGFGNIVTGVSTPVLAKHSKSFSLIDCISVGVDRMQRNFEPMRKQVEVWQRSELTDVTAKVVIYEAFVGGQAGGSEASGAYRARSLLRAKVRGVSFTNNLEPLERVHFRIQRTGADSTVQGDSKARRVPGDSLLAVVLTALDGTGRAAVLFNNCALTANQGSL